MDCALLRDSRTRGFLAAGLRGAAVDGMTEELNDRGMTVETIDDATPPEGWWLQTSVIYWDHMIVVDYLRLARLGADASDSQATIHAWLSCYRQAFELALKSLMRAAESKLFDRSYRDTGSEEPHCNIESKLTHHNVHELTSVLEAHLRLCCGRGVNRDVRTAAAFFRQLDPDGDKLRYGHGLPKAGFAESFPQLVGVSRSDVEAVDRAIEAMLDRGELALLTAARPVHPDGTECDDDEMAIPVRTKQSPRAP
jgi:hypothetical protein